MGGPGANPDAYNAPGSQTAGVKPMAVEGLLGRERDRLAGMTDVERAWRKKWLKDQVLTPSEPKYIKELEKEFRNPIRRAYRFPMDVISYRMLQPVIGEVPAQLFRFYVGKIGLIMAGIWGAWYLLKYNPNNWTSRSGWRIIKSRPAIYPGEPGFGEPVVEKKPNDYMDRGFKASILNKWDK